MKDNLLELFKMAGTVGIYIVIVIGIMLFCSMCGGNYQEQYDKGYKDGYEAGKEDGYSEGYTEGFSEGETPYQPGEDEYWNIYIDGYKEGYSSGFDDGKNGEKYDDDY